MGNVLDYLQWRGDLSFGQSEFNHVDALILCQFSYLNLSGIVLDSFSDRISLFEAWNRFSELSFQKERTKTGLLVSDLTLDLFENMAKSKRFSAIELCGYVNIIDEEEEKQFSAITAVIGDGTKFIVYRGTDDTLVGWKEDFNMSFLDRVPSQLSAVKYITNAADNLSGKLRIGGHSKGGNLAIYASSFCSDEIRDRIIDIYNNDGPGFQPDFISGDNYKKIYKRIHSYVPQSSVIGMLFAYHEEYIVVQSRQFGLFQHNMFNWQVLGTKFVSLDKLTNGSEFVDQTLRDWIMAMNDSQKEKFVDALFDILGSTEARTLTELTNEGIKKYAVMLKKLNETDEETKEILSHTVQLLFATAKKNLISNHNPKQTALEKIGEIAAKVTVPKTKKYIKIKHNDNSK